MFQVTSQRKFSNVRDYDDFALVRVPNKQLTALGGRGAWVRIANGNRHVFRTIKGVGGPIAEFPANAIELDYDTVLALNLREGSQPLPNGFYSCSLSLRPATRWERWHAHWRHPNPNYRFPIQLSIVGLALGVIGLALGIISLF